MSAKERRIQSIKEKIGYVIDDIAKKYRCRAYYIMNYDAYVFIVRFKNERGESAKMLIEQRVIDALQDSMLAGFLNKVADKATETLVTLVNTNSEDEIAELEKEAAASSVKNFGDWG